MTRIKMPYKRRSKFGAVPTVVDGIRFHSAKEARRYQELKLLERAGEIRDLELQPRFRLSVQANQELTLGAMTDVGAYVGDFRYLEVRAGRLWKVVEDVKGFKTPLYKWKKKHAELQYRIQIREV